ncbi:MAG: acyltransferase [Hoeflea sp.]|uniref:acyltransferase family protein n=1 Tax=Hoeflea sp. TaxID=1940281 RepID=UPI001D63AA7E|nr:acyltransferase [Hoeflea sp.]MBU4531710.1 acyltransferase [Alphaproteobacteria bacterium]MBU4544566.1 acyltransferase [Alphaproteobacteria bacterium]MBU4552797.1 acyltransferase [Alphaproteobacteria bacterium]MBV1724986.1 acyltransferase [Hoeflea sp.]MBV1761006.1 acyltransferase [Hoeflea sp.]
MRQTYRLFGVWRLLAAMLVMAYHFSHSAPNSEPVIEWFEHMLPLLDMFFIMSGFLIFEHYGRMENTGANYVTFLIKRLSRLYPLHLITLSFFVAFAVLVHLGLLQSQAADTRYDLSALPANLLLIQAWGVNSELTFNYVSWSLSAEWFAYLIFPIVLFAFAHGRAMGLALLLAVIIAAIEIADHGATDKYDYWFNAKVWAAYRVAADFVFGALLCVVARQISMPPPRCQILAWGMLGCVFAAMFSHADIYLTLALFGAAIVLAALTERVGEHETAWLEPVMPMAVVSFGVYLWHPVIELFAYALIWKRVLGIDDPLLFWIYMPLPMIVTIGVAMVSARRFERPVGKWIETSLNSLVLQRRTARPKA